MHDGRHVLMVGHVLVVAMGALQGDRLEEVLEIPLAQQVRL